MENYNITGELHLGMKVSEQGMDTMLGRLDGYSPAIGRSPHGRLECTITVPADSLGQAVTTAIALIEQGTRLNVVHVEAMSTELFDRRLGVPVEALPELVSITEAAELLEITRQRVLQLVDAGTLPGQRVGNAIVIPRAAVVARRDAGR